jgi:hypothetical protein
VREDADVAAAENRDTGGKRSLEARALAGDRLGLRLLPFLPAGVLLVGIDRGEGRAERNVTLGHQLEYFRRTCVAVFDGVDASHDRVPHPFDTLSVSRNRCAARVGGAYARRQ